MKKLLAILLCAIMLLSVPVALADEDVTLTMCIGTVLGTDSVEVLKVLLDEFTAETGIKVELVEDGGDHDSVMKTRMASNNMPDLWDTHGWCVLRYGEYCMDLSNEAWVADMDPSIKAVLTNADGQILGCPLTQWTYGIVYNEAVFADAGIDTSTINTWDDLMAMCETLKNAGYTPISVGSKGNAGPAGFLEMMNTFYSIDNSPYQSQEALLDGSFDFVENTHLLEYFAEMFDNGYIIEDLYTADSDTAMKYLGTGACAMYLWGGTSDITTLKRNFPDGEFGFMAIPAAAEGYDKTITVGEGTNFAASKDTQHPEEVKALLAFLVEPENLLRYATINGGLPGFTNVEMPESDSLTKYNAAVEAAGENLTFTNFFDREWLPSGMWNAMKEALGVLFTSDNAVDSVKEAGAVLQDAYDSLI